MEVVRKGQSFPPGFIKSVRDRIADLIANYSANDVPTICRRYGLPSGEVQEAFQGKAKYVSKRLLELTSDEVIEKAREVAHEEGDPELLQLLSSLDSKQSPQVQSSEMTGPRRYYAERHGKTPGGGRLELSGLKKQFKAAYDQWDAAGYFQEHFGFWCVDDDEVPGLLGDVDASMMLSLGKDGLWPIRQNIEAYSEDDLLSVVEFVHDHISKPLTGHMHSYSGCGMHWSTFDQPTGRAEYRAKLNVLLARYGSGYELSATGEVLERPLEGAANLLTTDLPMKDGNVQARVQSAIKKYRQRQSTADDRRDAVRDLADVLEYLRPQVKQVLTKKDESDLFEIANNFSIRHHRPSQKSDYDPAIWLSWMFYFYLATIHACVRMIGRSESS